MKKKNKIILIIISLMVICITSVYTCTYDDNETLDSDKDVTDTITTPNTEPATATKDPLENEGYTKIYEDNFNGDLSGWQIWNSGAFNGELQHYQPANLEVRNGILSITAKKESVRGIGDPHGTWLANFGYTSGRIESNFEFAPTTPTQKIRISARVKAAPGYGMWSAFWSYKDPWPTHGEIDIVEAIGQAPRSYNTDYFYGANIAQPTTVDRLIAKIVNVSPDITQDYHIYEVIWSRDSLIYMFDGEAVETKPHTEPGNEFIPQFHGKPQHIVLNLAVGGNIFHNLDPTLITTGTMYVDWVKVYRSE
ncbi:glycoside hydrolase family 16 protein [Flavobacterium psychrotrophum]|uniref:glycoside hydrolase family 16 protein n=1 Tax=Flavobacterium psychrotrophum TaxID=2294119 RepID=UPI000E32183B|nr:glycoside hydrolase family 16 protein [Flavobacterium psychrotrophum]